MGRNEIRLRRQRMSSGRIAQHRNYGDIMARHERDIRIKRVIKIFAYFLVILFAIILFFMVRSWEQKLGVEQPIKQTSFCKFSTINFEQPEAGS